MTRSKLGLLCATLMFLPAAAAKAAPGCERLTGMQVAARLIALPTTGAHVTSVLAKPAEGAGATKAGPYCLVSGEIMPVDPGAPPIRFQLALPDRWNGKAAMLGGAGFDGVVPKVTGNILNAPPTARAPLARGYAVFGSDSGHAIAMAGPGFDVGRDDGRFMLNDEAYRNYLGDAVKKTRDVALKIIVAAYGRVPTRSYFLGSSKGGAEGLVAAARWPADWDGVVALYPARNSTVLHLGTVADARAFAAPDAFPDIAKRRDLYKAALAQCDALDGLADGVISDTRGCAARFDPATAVLYGKPLRCPGGGDTGEDCLSDAQIAALDNADHKLRLSAVGAGTEIFPGFNIYTADMGGSTSSPLEPHVADLTIGRTAPTFPAERGNALRFKFADNFMRYAVAHDPSFNYLTFDPNSPGVLAPRLAELMRLDQGDADLTGFAARGGKLLIMHGEADLLIPSRGTEQYYLALVARMGERKLDTMLRYYQVPGFGHAFSTVYNAAWDQLTALENWVEYGVDPAHNQVVEDLTGVPGRTRPLCLYPTWPRYRGNGDVNAASSFACAK